MDPITLGILIATIVTSSLTFLLNIYQSIKSEHFHSECYGFDIDYHYEDHDQKDEKK